MSDEISGTVGEPMSDESIEHVPATPPPLAPGDADPLSAPRVVAPPDQSGPLGPGDDDGSAVGRGTAHVGVAPALPGDGPASEFDVLTPQAPGPGDVSVQRQIVKFDRRPKPAQE